MKACDLSYHIWKSWCPLGITGYGTSQIGFQKKSSGAETVTCFFPNLTTKSAKSATTTDWYFCCTFSIFSSEYCENFFLISWPWLLSNSQNHGLNKPTYKTWILSYINRIWISPKKGGRVTTIPRKNKSSLDSNLTNLQSVAIPAPMQGIYYTRGQFIHCRVLHA